MGASNFSDSAYAVTAKDAYAEAVDRAHYNHGHDPYNGTISTTEGFKIYPLLQGETLEEWHNRAWDNPLVMKRGDCACVADPDKPIVNGITLWHFAGWAAE